MGDSRVTGAPTICATMSHTLNQQVPIIGSSVFSTIIKKKTAAENGNGRIYMMIFLMFCLCCECRSFFDWNWNQAARKGYVGMELKKRHYRARE